MAERFDQFYMTIAQETGGIQGLFDSMFSFLWRKTDFYYETDPGDKMGFPPGVNIKIMYEIFQKYQQEHYKKYPKKSLEEYNQKLQTYKDQQQPQETPKQPEQTEKKTQEDPEKAPKKEPVQKKTVEVKNIPVVRKEEEEKEVPLQDKKVEDINTYNGGKTDKYSWSQSVNDVTVAIRLPQHTKPKDIKVDFKSTSVKILLKNEVVIQGDFFDKIKADDSFWTMEDGCLLVLTLEKGCENIWKTILKGDSEIDATKVDNSKSIHDFDDETQGALRKIMYEQERKMKGLPTTEEENQQEMIKKAWNAEGSPFKGTPYDPSLLNMTKNT